MSFSVHRLAQGLPLTPVVDLVRLGLTGTTATGDVVGLGGGSIIAATLPIVILGAWLAGARPVPLGATPLTRCARLWR